MIFNVTLTNEDDDGNTGNRRYQQPEPHQTPQGPINKAMAALEDEKNGTAWLRLLKTALPLCQTLGELEAVRGLPSFKHAVANWPTSVVTIITDLVREAVDRLSPQPDPEPEDDVQLREPSPSMAIETSVAELNTIIQDMDGMASEDEIVQWSATTTTKNLMAALKKKDPAAYAQAIGIIDERRVQLAGK